MSATFSDPPQVSHATQTEAQPNLAPTCVPLLMVDEDGRKRYCYHGGRCKCNMCARIKDEQNMRMDQELLAYMPPSRFKLEVPFRYAKPKQYRLEARRIIPEMAKELREDHERLRAQYPAYYLPDRYFTEKPFVVLGPQHKMTQTEIPIGRYGIDGCPCPNKTLCFDL
ncbi:hypothetical protein KR018_009107 [Drosophila ironensis]|nr:hypothetical protein KR018_009107 [Drosophila ironensis]